jgi:PhzF family phenazine biosynthesis protein
MKLRLFQVDAFTSRRFGGNPAAVVVLDRWLDDVLLQAIAAENNLSETAYVISSRTPCPLRWFTPVLEIDLCGHATLAAAHVLLRHYLPEQPAVTFETRSGPLTVAREGKRLVMDFPARPGRPIPVDDALEGALGVRPREAVLARDLLAIFDSEETIRAFRPDAQRIVALDAFGLIISARGRDVDFVSRFFGPRAGVLEDPVTGSAHCTLIPYWAARLGRNELTARQLSARGGELQCALRGDRVTIAGGVVEYLRGEIEV